MDSLLNPTLANIFMCHHKTIWFKRWSKNFWLKCYKRFVDDIIALFEKCEHLEQFAEYMNKQHPNIRSSAKAEKNDALPFLDIKIYTENGKFPVCTGKKTFSGVYTIFTSYILLEYKSGLFYTLFYQCFCLVSQNLKNLRIFFWKFITHRNLCTNAFLNF